VNIPSDTTVFSMLTAFGDSLNFIHVFLSDGQLFIDIRANGEDFIESYDNFQTGSYEFNLDWGSDVVLRINGVPTVYTSTGDIFGTVDDGFGTSLGYFGVNSTFINFTTPLTNALIGNDGGTAYYNNTFTEVTV